MRLSAARAVAADRSVSSGLSESFPLRTGRSRSSLVLLGLLAVAGIALFTSLGVWQLHRLQWKLDLIERVDRRIHATAVPVPPGSAWLSINDADDSYRRLTASGHFLHRDETLVQAVTDQGPGFWVMTPFQTTDGTIVLVNRGFVTPERRAPRTRLEGNPAGMTRITGLLRITEPKGAFLRTNDPSANRWYSRDVAAIAASHGLSGVAPFFVDADATPNPGGWPQGGLTVVAFRNSHLVYALTWFALALMVAGACLIVARHEWRLRTKGLDLTGPDAREPVGGR